MINIIANIRSGKGLGLKSLKKVTAYLADNAIDYTLYVTNYKGHATEIARSVSESGGTVIAMGGDGTFHEVVNGIADIKNTRVGFIPAGRGNDFARATGFSLNPIKALKTILKGHAKKIDYIQVGDKRCINVSGTGMDVKVLELADKSQNSLSYLNSLLYCLTHYKTCKATISVDGGEQKTYDCFMIGVCNGIAFGGNMRISPLSKIDDGLLDVIIIEMPKDGKVLKLVPKFTKGKHLNMPITTHIRCKSVTIQSAEPVELDGEIYYDLPFECKIVEHGLSVYMPE